MAINFLHFGYGEVKDWSAPCAGCLTEGQSGAWTYPLEQATFFVEQPGVVPDTDWGEYLQARRVDYSGNLVMKGLPLTWKQVEPGLPPEELAGSVDAASIAAPNLRRYLEDPLLSIKPRAACLALAPATDARAGGADGVAGDPGRALQEENHHFPH